MHIRHKILMAGLVGLMSLTVSGYSQASDPLIDKLVEKGILTVKEANTLREETDKGFQQAFQVKTGMPDWVKGWRLNGDFRGRYEGFFRNDPSFVDRNRFRYRLRAGLTFDLLEDIEVGIRVASGEPAGGPIGFTGGGDPVSGNTTLGNNGSKKFMYLDMVYAKWVGLKTADTTGTITFGKMENPFEFPSTMVFDKDYTPEGLAFDLSYNLNEKHNFKFVGAGFVLDEAGGTSRDAYMLGVQARWNAAWKENLTTTLGVASLNVLNPQTLTTAAVPNQGAGNTRTAGGSLVNNYQPIYTDADITWKKESFPFYTGAFPITLSGDYMYNPGAQQDNQGYSIGLTLGKSGKKGLWDFNYRWTELQADAWYEEFPESDFGAVYAAAPAGGAAGYQYGANIRGHWFKLGYSPTDSVTLSVAYFLTELISENTPGSGSSVGRIQVDAVVKF